MSATRLVPVSAMVTSSSLRMISIARVTPACAAGAEAVQIGTADHAGARAERERAHHVLARADAAVEHDLDLGPDGVDDPGQRRDRGHGAVELPAAVIGDDERRSRRSWRRAWRRPRRAGP